MFSAIALSSYPVLLEARQKFKILSSVFCCRRRPSRVVETHIAMTEDQGWLCRASISAQSIST